MTRLDQRPAKARRTTFHAWQVSLPDDEVHESSLGTAVLQAWQSALPTDDGSSSRHGRSLLHAWHVAGRAFEHRSSRLRRTIRPKSALGMGRHANPHGHPRSPNLVVTQVGCFAPRAGFQSSRSTFQGSWPAHPGLVAHHRGLDALPIDETVSDQESPQPAATDARVLGIPAHLFGHRRLRPGHQRLRPGHRRYRSRASELPGSPTNARRPPSVPSRCEPPVSVSGGRRSWWVGPGSGQGASRAVRGVRIEAMHARDRSQGTRACKLTSSKVPMSFAAPAEVSAGEEDHGGRPSSTRNPVFTENW
jgi:hypothetical protein